MRLIEGQVALAPQEQRPKDKNMTKTLHDDEVARYARQLILPEIGDAGQDKLKASKLGIIGAGGLGTPILALAAAAGFGHITIIDDDVIEDTNLNRQFLYTPHDIGASKARIAATLSQKQNPHITIEPITERLDVQNADDFISCHDVIIDASDNSQTRLLANRTALRHERALIFVSAIRFEGQMALFAPHKEQDSPCYECLFPDQPAKGLIANCATAGIAGPVTAILGSWAVLEAMKWQIGTGTSLLNQLLLFDGLSGDIDKIKTKKMADCPSCGVL